MNQKRTGFLAPFIEETHHILGSSGIPLPVINPSGDFTNYIPDFESQLEPSFDSYGCTVYGTLNAIETMENFLGNKVNYSDRFTYNAAEVKIPGDEPHRIATVIRGTGLVEQSELSDDTTSLTEFMTPRPLPVELRIKGQQWLSKKELGHQWLWTYQPRQEIRVALLKEALTKGTVCISVSAWYKNEQGLYYSPKGVENEHWTHVYKIDDTGIYVFDSYKDANTGEYLKKLTLDHSIEFAKVYFFTTPTSQQNWLIEMIKSLLQFVGLYQKKVEVVTPVAAAIPPVVLPPQPIVSELNWSSPDWVRHSIRVIADRYSCSVLEKDLICDICKCESGFNVRAIGIVDKHDRGLFQWNSKYHPEIIDEIAFDPEKNTKLAIHAVLDGKAKTFWSASMKCWNKNGKYDSLL